MVKGLGKEELLKSEFTYFDVLVYLQLRHIVKKPEAKLRDVSNSPHNCSVLYLDALHESFMSLL